MQNNIVKSKLGFRWVLHELNLKSADPTFFSIDKFILKNIQSGDSCCLDDLPEFYSQVIPNLHSIPIKKYQNIIAINSSAFDYKSIEEIEIIIGNFVTHLDTNGNLIISINFDNLIYDRVNISIDLLITTWINSLKNLNLICVQSLYCPQKFFGYGDYFFIFKYG
jgi:hypothetical protein